jgi:hypothetical protein
LAGGRQASADEPRRSRKLQAKTEKFKALSEAKLALNGEIDPELDERIKAVCERLMVDLDLYREQEDAAKAPPSPPAPRPFIKPLSAEARARIPSVNELQRNPQMVAANFGRNPVQWGDLLKVLPASSGATDRTGAPVDWLNDNAINAFFDALCTAARGKLNAKMERDGMPIRDNVPRFHALNTTWYKDITANGYEKVSRWAKRAKCGGQNLLSVERLFIPVHLGAHWVLAVVEPTVREVRVYDSLGNRASMDDVLRAVQVYLAGELAEHWRPAEWAFAYGNSGHQANMNDCGVYTCFNALASFYGDPAWLVGSRDLADAREAMAALLMSGGFAGEFDLETYHDGFALLRQRPATNGLVVNGA